MSSDLDDPLKSLTDIYKPDERHSYLAESLEELHARLSCLILHNDVPVDVRQMFETAKNVRLYTFFVYPFHQVAEMLAFQTLERALRTRWNTEVEKRQTVDDANYKWPGLAFLLKHAGSNGWIRSEGFSNRHRRAINALNQERTIAAIESMASSGATKHALQEPTLAEIEELAKQVDVVKILELYLPTLRNNLAHGSTRLEPSSDFVLQDICDAISMIFDGVKATRSS